MSKVGVNYIGFGTVLTLNEYNIFFRYRNIVEIEGF